VGSLDTTIEKIGFQSVSYFSRYSRKTILARNEKFRLSDSNVNKYEFERKCREIRIETERGEGVDGDFQFSTI